MAPKLKSESAIFRQTEEFKTYKKECMQVIRDMFGLNTKNYNIMKEKIKESKNSVELSNVMAYGRSKLL